MDLPNILKGALAGTALSCLLRQAGYPVASGAVEDVFPILRQLTRTPYMSVPPEIRLLPDLLIPHEGRVQLVEIKYRSVFDLEAVRKLVGKLTPQQERFSGLYTVLLRGTSPAGDRATLDDLVRVVPPASLPLLKAAPLFCRHAGIGPSEAEAGTEIVWQSMEPLPRVFDRLQATPELLPSLVPLLRFLGTL